VGKKAKLLGAVLGAVAGGVAALYYALFRRPLPQTEGTLRLQGLERDVEIIRDRWGVPHIYAENETDLFFAQGFVHAQDRLFQMDFWRRLASGRLAEVLGPPAVEVDRWMRIIGLRRVAEKEVSLLDDRARELMFAYASGVSAYIDGGKLPLEFTLLRYNPERWQIADTLAWGKYMDWSLSVNWEAELLTARLVDLLGPERAQELLAPYPDGSPVTLAPGIQYGNLGSDALKRAGDARPFTGPPTEAGQGSNNWVVDGTRTAGGAPLLASDMHLALTMPGIWYENHLSCPEFEVAGLIFPGMPGVIAGHNGRVAWSFTAGFTDTQDLYVERFNPQAPHQYEFEGAWHDAEAYHEQIVIKGGEVLVQKVMVTRHGPLIDGLSDAVSEPLALCWTALDPSDMLGMLFDICAVQDCESLHQALRRWAGPVQNVVYADVEGNIGYTLAGRTPIRQLGHDGQTPVSGWSGEYEWQGYVPFEDWPHAINPPDGTFVTANGKPVGDDYPYYLGQSWLPGYRAARIRELLEGAERLTVADFCHMQFDQKSVLARRFGPHLRRLAPEVATDDLPVAGLFDHWEGELSADSAAAAVYEVFVRRLLYNVFGDVLVGTAGWEQDLPDRFVGQGLHPVLTPTGYYGVNGRALLLRLLDNEENGKNGENEGLSLFEQHTRDELMTQSLREAVEYLRWQLGPQVDAWRWGDLHQLTFTHPLGQVPPLDKLFNRGPYPIGGDESTIWATAAFYHSLDSSRMVGPVCRFVVDLGDLRWSLSLNAPGQSGQPGSRHYDDRIRPWFEGDYHPILFRREDVVEQAEGVLHLLATGVPAPQ
jgi:penicillin amidase